MLVAVIADTHLPRGTRRLPERCVELIAGSEALLHAGDFSTAAVLGELEQIGPPVHGVHGNVDEPALRELLPETLTVNLAGKSVSMVHDAGPRRGRVERLRRAFPQADAVIFGHSHMPEHQASGEFQIFNPGSPTERRRAERRSMGLMRIDRGAIDFEHVDLS
jgi:putative phosphoesterase